MTVLTASPNPSTTGALVTFRAEVSAGLAGGVPTGNVTFVEGETPLGTGSLDSDGIVTFQTSTLVVGSHTISAMYGGDDAFTASVSNPVDQVVNGPPSRVADLSVTEAASSAPITAGAALTYTMTVTNNGPDPATGVVLNDILPAGTSVISAGASQGDAELLAGGTIAKLGDLAAGVSATVTLVLRTFATGSVTNTVQVSGQEDDPVTGNNTATLTTQVDAAPPASGQLAVVNVQRVGVHDQPTRLVLRLIGPLDPARAIDLTNYRIVGAGKDGKIGDRDDVDVPIARVGYEPASETVTLNVARRINIHHPYRLMVRGASSSGLADTPDRFLEGARNGNSGDGAIIVVTWKDVIISRDRGRASVGLGRLRHLVWPGYAVAHPKNEKGSL